MNDQDETNTALMVIIVAIFCGVIVGLALGSFMTVVLL